MLSLVMKKFRETNSLCTNEFNRETIEKLLDKLGKQLKHERLFILTYEDLKMYYELIKYMPAYDIAFIQNKFIPYLKEHNPETLAFLDLTIAFYSLVIYDILTDDIITISDDLKFHLNSNNISIFDFCWNLLDKIMNLDKHERTIFPTGFEFYVTDDMYRLIEKCIIKNFYNSQFEIALERILGIYRMRFSCVKYINKYQPMFLRVVNNYKDIL